jgi:dTDP-4-amino-4,6-dideoxygalactose transaminase
MARLYLSPPHLSGHEPELVKDAFASSWIAPLGPHVDAFEREFAAAEPAAQVRVCPGVFHTSLAARRHVS